MQKFGCMNDFMVLRKKSLYFLFIILLSSSLLSNNITNIKATTTPTLISPADASYVTTSTPTATWSSVSGATDYHIQLSLVSDFSTIMGEDYITSTSYTPATGLPDNTYYWRVRAHSLSGGGWSLWPTAWTFTVDTAAPATPTLVDPNNF